MALPRPRAGPPAGTEELRSGLTWVTAEKNAWSSVGTASAHWTTRAQLAMGRSSWWRGANLEDTTHVPLSTRPPTPPGPTDTLSTRERLAGA